MSGSVPILIVGTGPAGLAASIQARRDLVDHVVVGREPAGGLVSAAWRIDNLPGFPGGVTGAALSRRLAKQADALGLPIRTGEVTGMEKQAGVFSATFASGERIQARCLILATGTVPRPWSAPVSGRLHRDVRTLPAALDGSTVAIVGGGDAALDSALSVHGRGGRPVVHARAALRANERIVRRIEERGIEVRTRSPIETAGLDADHLIVCIGRVPDDALYRLLVPDGPLPPGVETPVEGLFVAGDLIAGHERYIALAQGDGQRAALLAEA
ncbi:MAG: NAD(P)/FAD-dependent oxidoreductase, partial [Deltaproteobacteria bacterium]|nr:NAD(P)/FAD-dependent oxidoreductase [Deltaproteobacteria bacterium]